MPQAPAALEGIIAPPPQARKQAILPPQAQWITATQRQGLIDTSRPPCHYDCIVAEQGRDAPMSRLPELASLEHQHAALDREIEAATARHDPDLKISELKRRKLHLKDEMERLRHAEPASVH
jgi:hypothetical protein